MPDRMRGILVENSAGGITGGRSKPRLNVSAVEIRYSDGSSFSFIPETRSEFFGQDEMLMIADRMLRASQKMEWDEVHNRASM